MIGALTGTVFTVNRNPLILMVGNVGYNVFVPTKLIGKLTLGQKITLYIHTHVRDDVLDFYGLPTIEELDLFNLLLDVPGVGPRTGLSIINEGVSAITTAASIGDVDFFQTIPRLGKKNAQKIIIELKSKIGSLNDLDLTEDSGSETKEFLDALMSMGFEKKEALQAFKKITVKDAPLGQKIRQALRYLAKT